MSETCSKCGDRLDNQEPPAVEEEGMCWLCNEVRRLERTRGNEVSLCAPCWSPYVYYLRGDHGTVVMSPHTREELEKLRRGEQP